MSILEPALKAYVRSGLRGSTRFPLALANRLRSLHSVPLQVQGWPTLYVDLRVGHAIEWFARSPWVTWPYNRDEQAVLRRFIGPGMTVADIGVNLGLYLAHMSHLVGSRGHVWGFEPNPALTPNLIRAAVQMKNATIVPVALNERPGPVKFFVPEDHMMASMWDWTQAPKASDVLTVPALRLDDVGLTAIDFVKVDAEGAELEIFKGARSALDRPDAPVVLYEALSAFGRDTFAATAYLKALPMPSYTIFRLLPNGTLTPFDRLDGNLVAIPKARMGN
jgi:FkbM family methyltransferase